MNFKDTLVSSLQDQLLQAGLVDNKKAKQVKKEKRKSDNANRRSKDPVVDQAKANAQKAILEKAEKDKKLNAERDAAAQKKAIAAQIKQLITLNRQSKGKGDIAYKFTDGVKIKSIYVADKIQQQLTLGQLAIVKLDGNYEVVPAKVAEKIAQRDESFIVNQVQKTAATLEEDDPYAEFQIPDDLMW
ncbi:MAG: hypothetical protein ACI9Y1_002521 [Lentisphaeria bacterium]|jgi:uncharacterized protein YaiL (DUF2058 family)